MCTHAPILTFLLPHKLVQPQGQGLADHVPPGQQLQERRRPDECWQVQAWLQAPAVCTRSNYPEPAKGTLPEAPTLPAEMPKHWPQKSRAALVAEEEVLYSQASGSSKESGDSRLVPAGLQWGHVQHDPLTGWQA